MFARDKVDVGLTALMKAARCHFQTCIAYLHVCAVYAYTFDV
jgi:hypothetical protein